MADSGLRVVLDDWVIPADSVPVMIMFGDAVIRVRAGMGSAAAQMARLAETMKTDPGLVFGLARLGTLEPARPVAAGNTFQVAAGSVQVTVS